MPLKMQLRRSLRLGRPLGIPLLVHGSWFPAAVLLVSHLALSVYPDLPTPQAIGMGILTALAFFACLVVHELGHAVVAKALGIGVRDITLFVFGGMARIAREPTRPAQELVIALAGPVVSAGLAVAMFAWGGDGTFWWTLGAANAALAGFNLLPGFPLDGGRVLRAVLWARTGDRDRAVQVAGRAGQIVGVLLFVAGFALFTAATFGSGAFSRTGGPEGLWLAVIGVFLNVLATASRRAARVASAFQTQSAQSWARPFAGTVSADATFAHLEPDGGGPYAISDASGRLAGVLVGAGRADPSARVADHMVPWTPKLSFPASRPLSRALERLAGDGVGVLVLVDEGGSVVGVLDERGIRDRMSQKAR